RGGHRHVGRKKDGEFKNGGQTECVHCKDDHKHAQAQAPPPKVAAPAAVEELKRMSVAELDAALVLSPLYKREWVVLDAEPFHPDSSFVFMQWNVLFSATASASKHTCPVEYLTYDHRLGM